MRQAGPTAVQRAMHRMLATNLDAWAGPGTLAAAIAAVTQDFEADGWPGIVSERLGWALADFDKRQGRPPIDRAYVHRAMLAAYLSVGQLEPGSEAAMARWLRMPRTTLASMRRRYGRIVGHPVAADDAGLERWVRKQLAERQSRRSAIAAHQAAGLSYSAARQREYRRRGA